MAERIAAARVGGDSADPSVVAGPGFLRTRKDVSRRGALASPQGKKLRQSGDDSEEGDEEQGLPSIAAGKCCVGCKRVTGRDSSFYTPEAAFSWLYTD